MDVTSLNDSDDAAAVHALSVLARAAPAKPAAVCDRAGPSASRLPAAFAQSTTRPVYLTLFEQRFATGSASARNFRIGASVLFEELMAAAGA